MTSFRFARFTLDSADRRLRHDGAPVELNARYLDALLLMLQHPAELVSKDRFMAEVWRGVPVTDEALTQCIKSLRRQLGDDASAPRFIQTVPKHGYRFIAPVETSVPRPEERAPLATGDLRRFLLLGGAGSIGGGMAGLIGGLFYGVAGVSQPNVGEVSVVLVLVCLSILAGLIGGAGVGFGIAAAAQSRNRYWLWPIAGGAAGGLVVGAAAKLLGLDAFSLLFGRSPGDITGAGEGALLGAAAGLGAWLAARMEQPIARAALLAGLAGGVAGLVIDLAGGTLMGGSLDQLARGFPGSRLAMDRIGTLFGEPGFGPLTRAVTSSVEGLLFGACVVAAMLLARRGISERA